MIDDVNIALIVILYFIGRQTGQFMERPAFWSSQTEGSQTLSLHCYTGAFLASWNPELNWRHSLHSAISCSFSAIIACLQKCSQSTKHNLSLNQSYFPISLPSFHLIICFNNNLRNFRQKIINLNIVYFCCYDYVQ